MKELDILKITKKRFKGYVYNLELKSKSNKDDLYWVEYQTGIITHNCFPKDINALIYKAKELGIDPIMLEAAWKKNLKIRKKRDWEDIPGAVS